MPPLSCGAYRTRKGFRRISEIVEPIGLRAQGDEVECERFPSAWGGGGPFFFSFWGGGGAGPEGGRGGGGGWGGEAEFIRNLEGGSV